MVLPSPAIALASKVLPVPGANEQNAFGDGPDRGEAFRLFEERDDFLQFFLCFMSMPATSLKVIPMAPFGSGRGFTEICLVC